MDCTDSCYYKHMMDFFALYKLLHVYVKHRILMGFTICVQLVKSYLEIFRGVI